MYLEQNWTDYKYCLEFCDSVWLPFHFCIIEAVTTILTLEQNAESGVYNQDI